MNTAQGGWVSSVGYVVMLVVCLKNAYRRAGSPHPLRRPQPVAIAIWLVVAIPSLVQIGYPAVFDALERRPTSIEHGEVWRLVTSVVVQDGGAVGTAFNLVVLGLTLPVAVTLWRARRAVALFITGAVTFNLLATFAWHQAGGGNSAATFFLATSMLGLLAATHQVSGGRQAALIVLAVGIVLLAVGDAHGVAVLAGLGAGFLIGRTRPVIGSTSAPAPRARTELARR